VIQKLEHQYFEKWKILIRKGFGVFSSLKMTHSIIFLMIKKIEFPHFGGLKLSSNHSYLRNLCFSSYPT